MKIQLKHVGYALLAAVVFINFWFFRFNLHESFFGERNCAYNNPCNPESWDTITQPWEGWSGQIDERSVDVGTMVITNSILDRMKYQIYWTELFATAMLDAIAVAMALAFIVASPSKEKSS